MSDSNAEALWIKCNLTPQKMQCKKMQCKMQKKFNFQVNSLMNPRVAFFKKKKNSGTFGAGMKMP
jgi:hypothetical protein